MPKFTGRLALKALLFGEKRERPEPVVTRIKELRVRLPVLPANEEHSVRGGSLVLEESQESTRLFFRIGRTVYNPRPSSEMDHIHSATDLSRELSMDASPTPLGESRWYEYLAKVLGYLSEDQMREHGYDEFIAENRDLMVAVEEEMGARNPSANYFG